MDKLTVRDADVAGKRVFVRVDFNVPLADGKVTDDSRIRAALPTINLLLQQGAKVILASHLGRPDGKVQDGLRLRPVGERLTQLLRRNVPVTGDALGVGTEDAIKRLRPGEVLLLENLRFHAEEEKNDPAFAATLASYADVYVNDAFGTAHRAHASTVGIAKLLPAYAGLLMEREIEMLSKLLEAPERPFAAILGGAKVSDKIKVIDHLLTKVDMLVLGGGMANTFLLAQGKAIGKSLAEPDRVDDARRILATAEANGVRVVLPIDVIVAKEVTRGTEYKTLPAEKIPASWHIVDLGKASQDLMVEALTGVRTVFWNGPLGVFEIPSFAHGTKAVARMLADQADDGATVVVGGGDSVAAVTQEGPGRSDDPHLHGRRRVARVPRRSRAAGRDRAPRPPSGRSQGMSTGIEIVDAREILDSRGNPTVEVDIVLADGSVGRAAVPSGASTGLNEAVELRDGDKARFGGKGVRKAVANVTDTIAPALYGLDATDQAGIDALLCELDGTPNKGNARRQRDPRRVARVRARRVGLVRPAALPLSRRRRRPDRCRCPFFNILNGGKHASDSTDFQEFMVAPVGAETFAEAFRAGRRGVRRAPRDPPRRGPLGRPGRRGRVRAEPADQRGRGRGHPPRHRARRLSARRGRRHRARPGGQLDAGRGHRRRRRHRPVPPRARGPDARFGRADRPVGALDRRATRSSRSRTGSPRRTGPAGASSTRGSARRSSSSATTSSSRTRRSSPAGSPRTR